MYRLPKAIQKLADELAELPSIGPRQAIRLAIHLVNSGQNKVRILAQSIDDLKNIKLCERCFFVHQNKNSLCDICGDASRRKDIVAVVEKETDLLSLENAKGFTGRYLVLGDIPKAGLLEDRQKLRLQNLKSFIEKECGGKAAEIIIALNPTSIGDFHASMITKELAPYAKKISRLGRGLPTGGEIEFADSETLGSALERRS